LNPNSIDFHKCLVFVFTFFRKGKLKNCLDDLYHTF